MKRLKDNQILITEIANGWVLNIPNPNIEGRIDLGVFDGEDCSEYKKVRVEAMVRLLKEIVEAIQPYSKHNKYNIEIKVIKK